MALHQMLRRTLSPADQPTFLDRGGRPGIAAAAEHRDAAEHLAGAHEAHHDLLPLGRHLRHFQAPLHQDVERLRIVTLPEYRLALADPTSMSGAQHLVERTRVQVAKDLDLR
jgi:hypothetical protein